MRDVNLSDRPGVYRARVSGRSDGPPRWRSPQLSRNPLCEVALPLAEKTGSTMGGTVSGKSKGISKHCRNPSWRGRPMPSAEFQTPRTPQRSGGPETAGWRPNVPAVFRRNQRRDWRMRNILDRDFSKVQRISPAPGRAAIRTSESRPISITCDYLPGSIHRAPVW